VTYHAPSCDHPISVVRAGISHVASRSSGHSQTKRCGDSRPYDTGMESSGPILRVQVKATWHGAGRVAMRARPVEDEFHATRAVKSRLLPSLWLPVALNC